MLSLCCGIGPGTRLSPESSLIHPNSPFYVFESVTIALFLMYTAVVTPVTVSFYWHQNPCEKMPTLEFDIFVDACFLADIVLTFFVGIYIEGRYVDDKAIVFAHYLRNGFLFDVCTSFPVSFMEASIIAQCEQGQSDLDISSSSLRMIRVMKPLRLIKLIRIIKVVKTLAIANAIGEMLRVPPRAVRLMKVLVGSALGVHTCSCIYWLCKTLSFSAEEVQQFLDELEIGSDVKSQYISSFYFITTIFTTIGFGDIVPLNLSERIFGIVVMYIGSITYGILLAEVPAGTAPTVMGATIAAVAFLVAAVAVADAIVRQRPTAKRAHRSPSSVAKCLAARSAPACGAASGGIAFAGGENDDCRQCGLL